MRGAKRALIVALLCTTAMTSPTQAKAGPVGLFFQGIAAAAGAYGAAGAAVGTAIGGTAAAGVAVGSFVFGTLAGRVLLSLALSAVVNVLTPRPEIPKPSSQFANYVQSVSPMERVYGEVKKGGVVGFRSGIRSKKKHQVVTVAAHPVEGPVSHFLDLREVTLAAGSEYDGLMDDGDVITTPYRYEDDDLFDPEVTVQRSYANIRAFTGGSGQVVDAVLFDEFDEITAAHDFAGHSGVAYWCKQASQEKHLKVWPGGREAVYSGVWRGWNEIYDPRDGGSVGWTNNAALCFAHELVNVWGLSVDWDRVAVEADRCDTLVVNRDGASQKTWTFNHTLTDDQSFDQVLAQFMGAMDGFVWQRPDGPVDFYVGRWIEPTLTLEAADFLSLQYTDGNNGLTPPTEYVAEYREPDNGYRETPSGPWLVEDATGTITRKLAIYGIDSHNQALRVLKPVARAERARYKMRGVIGLIGYEVIGGRANDAGGSAGLAHRFVKITHPILGTEVTVEVSKILRNAGGNSFEVEFTSTAEDDRTFEAATEEPAPPSYNAADVSASDPIDTIDDLTGVAVTGTGGVAQIDWSWTAADGSLVPVLYVRPQGGVWVEHVLSSGASSFRSTGLVDGETYEAQIRNRTNGYTLGDRKPDTPVSVLAVANSVAPAAHASGSFALSQSGGDVTVDFEAPNDPAYYATLIYRADYGSVPGSYDIGDATLVRTEYGLPGQVDAWEDTVVAAGHHAYWIIPINASGVVGPTTGEATIDTV